MNHDDDGGGWWSRSRAVKERTAPSKNDRVADLWSRHGWGDDDIYEADDNTGLGQVAGPKYKGRSSYRRGQYERAAKQTRRVGDNTARRAITAHGMVQSFISTFSTDTGGAYKVVFSLNTPAPAATSFEQHLVLVDPTPIFDTSISSQTCGLVMTALSVHEVSHIEFDRHHGEAVKAAIVRNQKLALRLSNILSDRRIEMRFAARYPGYGDVFDPALEYICREHHGMSVTFNPQDPGNIVVAAVRYAKWLDWSAPGMDAERIWWDDLATRAAQSDDEAWHVKHVQEGLKRLVKMIANAPKVVEPHPFKP